MPHVTAAAMPTLFLWALLVCIGMPRACSVIEGDLHELSIPEFAQMMEIDYLNQTQEEPTFPIHGWLFEEKIYVSVICSRKDRRLKVVFRVNTGVWWSSISRQAMHAFVGESMRSPVLLDVHGHVTPMYFDPALNELGMRFITSHELSLKIDYRARRVQLHKSAC